MNKLLVTIVRSYIPTLIIASLAVIILISSIISQFYNGISLYSKTSLLIGMMFYFAGILLTTIAKYWKSELTRSWPYLFVNIIAPLLLFLAVTAFFNSESIIINNHALFMRLFPIVCGVLAIIVGICIFTPDNNNES